MKTKVIFFTLRMITTVIVILAAVFIDGAMHSTGPIKY